MHVVCGFVFTTVSKLRWCPFLSTPVSVARALLASRYRAGVAIVKLAVRVVDISQATGRFSRSIAEPRRLGRGECKVNVKRCYPDVRQR